MTKSRESDLEDASDCEEISQDLSIWWHAENDYPKMSITFGTALYNSDLVELGAYQVSITVSGFEWMKLWCKF